MHLRDEAYVDQHFAHVRDIIDEFIKDEETQKIFRENDFAHVIASLKLHLMWDETDISVKFDILTYLMYKEIERNMNNDM
jgi:hypothetical protein